MKPGAPPAPPDREIFPTLDPSWPADGFGEVAKIAAELPAPEGLRPGALVVVHARPSRSGGRFFGLSWRAPRYAHAAVRCTALLARGYTRVGAARGGAPGEETVWGYVDARTEKGEVG